MQTEYDMHNIVKRLGTTVSMQIQSDDCHMLSHHEGAFSESLSSEHSCILAAVLSTALVTMLPLYSTNENKCQVLT